MEPKPSRWKKFFSAPLAILLILIGIIALFTPLTPGSWLIPIGIGMLLGKSQKEVRDGFMKLLRLQKRVLVAGGVILNAKGEVLLVHNKETDSWTYPKGHVEDGEDLTEAARREILEETNIRGLTFVEALPVYERKTRQDKKKIKEMHMFLYTTGETDIHAAADDIAATEWVSLDEVSERFSYPEEVTFFKNIKPRLETLQQA